MEIRFVEGGLDKTGATSQRCLFEVLDDDGQHVTFVASGLAFTAMSLIQVDEQGAEQVIRDRAPARIEELYRAGQLSERDSPAGSPGTVLVDLTSYDFEESG